MHANDCSISLTNTEEIQVHLSLYLFWGLFSLIKGQLLNLCEEI